MTTTAATVLEGEFKMVPLSAIRNSRTNPRKTFDAGAITELAASIAQVGLLQPIVVRPLFGENFDYELVSGERRYRACTEMGKELIQAHIRHLTDDQAFEVQIIENLQRRDIHPMDEAYGFEQLLKRPNFNHKEVGLRVGKSERYVTERIRLLKLSEDFQKRFFADEINIAQAITIAKYQPHQQKEILDHGTWNPEAPFNLTTKELHEFIRENILLELSTAPWKKDDAELYPEAGACKTCEKRTGFNQQLFAELSDKDRCTDAICFKEKRFLFIEKKAQRLTREEESFFFVADEYSPSEETKTRFPGMLSYSNYRKLAKDEAACDYMEKGLCVGGAQPGQMVFICYSPECQTHSNRYVATAGVKADDNPAFYYDHKIKRAKEIHEQNLQERISKEFISAPDFASVKFASEEIYRSLVLLLWEKSEYYTKKDFNQVMGWRDYGCDFEENYDKLGYDHISLLIRLNLANYNHITPDSVYGRLMVRLAREFGIDVDAITADQTAILQKKIQRYNELKDVKLAALNTAPEPEAPPAPEPTLLEIAIDEIKTTGVIQPRKNGLMALLDEPAGKVIIQKKVKKTEVQEGHCL